MVRSNDNGAGLAALRAAGLSQEETELAASYLYDRLPQGDLAMARGLKRTTMSKRIRAIMAKLEAAGLPVRRPKRGSSKPSFIPDRPRLVTVDPETISRMSIHVDSQGMIHGKFNGTGDRAELPLTDEHVQKRISIDLSARRKPD